MADNTREIVGVKMEWIGGLMLKVLDKYTGKSRWLPADENVSLMAQCENPTIQRIIDFWTNR